MGIDPAKIVECEHSEIQKWTAVAARERVSLQKTPGTRWFRYEDVGCCGLMMMGNGTARLKGMWIDKAWRGDGLGDAFLKHMIREALKAGAKAVEGFALREKWFLREGFQEVSRNSAGVALMRRETSGWSPSWR